MVLRNLKHLPGLLHHKPAFVCLFVFTIVSHHQNDVKLYQLGQKTLVLFEHIVTYFIRSSNRPTEAGPEICLLRFLAVTTATS